MYNLHFHYKQIFIIVCTIYTNFFYLMAGFESTLGHLKSKTDPEIQEAAVQKLVKRLLKDKADLFHIKVDPSLARHGKDLVVVKKSEDDTKVYLKGSSGVAAAWGLNYYLRYFCNCQISWEYHKQLKIPNPLPNVYINIASQDR
jgi:alpha-N-acetylglucosaminidase